MSDKWYIKAPAAERRRRVIVVAYTPPISATTKFSIRIQVPFIVGHLLLHPE